MCSAERPGDVPVMKGETRGRDETIREKNKSAKLWLALTVTPRVSAPLTVFRLYKHTNKERAQKIQHQEQIQEKTSQRVLYTTNKVETNKQNEKKIKQKEPKN